MRVDDDPAAVLAYVASVPEASQTMLAELRRLIRETAPEAAETVSYGMLGYRHRGRVLVYTGGWQKHCALYATREGTVQFPVTEPLPEERVRALVAARVEDVEAMPPARSRTPAARRARTDGSRS